MLCFTLTFEKGKKNTNTLSYLDSPTDPPTTFNDETTKVVHIFHLMLISTLKNCSKLIKMLCLARILKRNHGCGY